MTNAKIKFKMSKKLFVKEVSSIADTFKVEIQILFGT